MATFKSYYADGGVMLWGVVLDDAEHENAKRGDTINVRKRNGQSKTVTLDTCRGPVLGNVPFPGGQLWSVVGAKPARGRRRGGAWYEPDLDGHCETCSKAIPSKYKQCLACTLTADAVRKCAIDGCESRCWSPTSNLCELHVRRGLPPVPAQAADNGPYPEW